MGIPVPRRENPKEGAYAGVVAAIWEVGAHVTEYEGRKEVKDKAVIVVELDGAQAGFIGGDRQHILYDEINLPMFWPGKRNSNLYSYADATLGSAGADALNDYEEIVGHGVQVGVKITNDRARVKTISPLMSGTAVPPITGDHSKPTGLASYLLEKAIPECEVFDLKKKFADEDAARKSKADAQAEADAEAFSAPHANEDVPF